MEMAQQVLLSYEMRRLCYVRCISTGFFYSSMSYLSASIGAGCLAFPAFCCQSQSSLENTRKSLQSRVAHSWLATTCCAVLFAFIVNMLGVNQDFHGQTAAQQPNILL